MSKPPFKHVAALAAGMSLRQPQRQALELLARITGDLTLGKGSDHGRALETVRRLAPALTGFDREFPSLCFALATGVGKTRLMGAFEAYMRLEHGTRNFLVLAPNLTIYRKLITDFTRGTPKYVFAGVSEFASEAPVIVTGETYEWQSGTGANRDQTTINIFNISKLNAELRGGRSSRIRSFREEIGASYFDHLRAQDDLVLIMDEAHRYRSSAGLRAINELKPVLGLELTATPFIETSAGPQPFNNVVFRYSLADAIEDGLVKEPAVVTREDFSPANLSPDEIERIKIEDGLRLHEHVKVELATYAGQAGVPVVKPIVLVIARDTSHAAHLVDKILTLASGRYAGKVIQVDSSVDEDELVARLLKVEEAHDPTEVIVHVNMLKEGWDVTNLYTIVPLRAANARILVEQSIGRGLRLPYGRRTGNTAVDRLNIVAHDRFQEIVEDARRADSPIKLSTLLLQPNELSPTTTIVSRPLILADRELGVPNAGQLGMGGFRDAPPEYMHQRQELAALAYGTILDLAGRPEVLPNSACLADAATQAIVADEIRSRAGPTTPIDRDMLTDVVAAAAERFAALTIDIPLMLARRGDAARSGYRPFTLDTSELQFDMPNETLWAAHLRTGRVDRIRAAPESVETEALEDRIVTSLTRFNDIAYDGYAEMLYDLAGQVTRHLRSTVSEGDARKIQRINEKRIADVIHNQMQRQFWTEEPAAAPTTVIRGFTPLKPSVYTAPAGVPFLDFRVPLPDKARISRYVFTGFSRCLYPTQKFDSDAERTLAVILDRDSAKWFRPPRGQFAITYRTRAEEQVYQPDFVAETGDSILILECKGSKELADEAVASKADAAVTWCSRATEYAVAHGGKPWAYLIVPHDAIAENSALRGLVARYAVAHHSR